MQIFLFDDIQHRHARRALHGIAAEGVEIHHPLAKLVDQIGAGRHARHRVAVAHGFAHGGDVGGCPAHLVAPHFLAGAGKPALHLIGDVKPARVPHQFHGLFHVAIRHLGQSFIGEDGADQHAGKANSLVLELVNGLFHLVGVGIGQGLSGQAVQGPVSLGERHGFDLGGGGLAAMKNAGQLIHGGGVAVIGVVGADDALLAGAEPRHAQGDFVGLAAGADDEGHGQGIVMQVGQPLGVFQHQLVQVAGMHIQGLGLFMQGLHHAGVAMPHIRDIVIDIQVLPAIRAVKPDPFSSDNMHRLVVEQGSARA